MKELSAPKGKAATLTPTELALRAEGLRRATEALKAISEVDRSAQLKKTFKVPRPPPGVVPEGEKIAMDDAAWESNYGSWLSEHSMFSEGLMFLGYPYLAELSQRSEYRKISETMAGEMTRKWIKISATGSDDSGDRQQRIDAIEAEFERLQVQEIFQRATEMDGFFGRSHIYIDLGVKTSSADVGRAELKSPIGDGSVGNALSAAKVKIGSLRAIKTIEPVWTYPNAYNSNDPLRDDYYNPTSWFVQGREIHASRLLTFVGRPVPDLLKPAYSFGGLALSQIAKPYVDNWLRTRQSVSDAISNFSIMMMMTDMSDVLNSGGADNLVMRAELFNAARDNRGLMLADKDTEDLKNVSMPLGTLDHLQAQSQEHMSAVSGIPLVKLTGISPSGLNATTDNELRVFYDWILSQQQTHYKRPIMKLLRFVQLSLFGSVDPKITVVFQPLWALDDAQKATARKTDADTYNGYIDHGVLAPQEVREAVAAEEDSPFTNIDLQSPPPQPPGQESEEAQPGQEPGMAEAAPGEEAQSDVHPAAKASTPQAGGSPHALPAAGSAASAGGSPTAARLPAPSPATGRDAPAQPGKPGEVLPERRPPASRASAIANRASEQAMDADGHLAAAMLHDAAASHYSEESNEQGYHKNTAAEHRNRAYELEHPGAPVGGGAQPGGERPFPAALDSEKSFLYAHDSAWEESKHPRATNGQFGRGGEADEAAAKKHLKPTKFITELLGKFNADQKKAGRESMSEAEFTAARYYQDESRDFNYPLRTGGFTSWRNGKSIFKPFDAGDEKTENFEHAVRALNSALDKLPKRKGEVTRYIDMQHPDFKGQLAKLLESMKPGNVVFDSGFMSATTLPTMEEFRKKSGGLMLNDPNIVLKIKSKTGVDISQTYLSSHPYEKEILFKSGTRFRVVSTSKERVKQEAWKGKPYDRHTIELEEVPGVGAPRAQAHDAFNEADHPRGQPENKGEFAKVAGSVSSAQTSGKKGEAAPIPSTKDQQAAIESIKDYEKIVAGFQSGNGKSKIAKHMPAEIQLQHGKGFEITPDTYKGQRGAQHGCFRNAGLDALENPLHTYVEGTVLVHGVPVHHAWTVDEQGHVIDQTITSASGIGGYYGVPIKRKYLNDTVLRTGNWGIFNHGNRQVFSDDPEDYVVKNLQGMGELGALPPITDPAARGPAVDRRVKEALAKGFDTETKYDKINGKVGRYTAEREAMHHQVCLDVLNKAKAAGAKQDKKGIVMGGAYAAGKTTALRSLLDAKYFVTVSPDDMKEELALRGFADPLPGTYPMEGSSLIHEETAKMAWDLAEMAASQGYNIIWDTSMGSSGAINKRIDSMKDVDGQYHITGVFIDAPLAQSYKGAEGRYANGLKHDVRTARFTDPARIAASIDPSGKYQTLNRAAFEDTKGNFDQWVLIDNKDYAHKVEAVSGKGVIGDDGKLIV